MLDFFFSGKLWYLNVWLEQIEEYYGAQDMGIVGYFHANERFDDAELSSVAKNIGDHIYRYFPQAAVILVGFCWLAIFEFAVYLSLSLILDSLCSFSVR